MENDYIKRLEEANKELEKSLAEALDAKQRLKSTLEVGLDQLLSVTENFYNRLPSMLSKGERETKIQNDFEYYKVRMVASKLKEDPDNIEIKRIREYVENVEHGRLHPKT